jgi:AcrR family transcriptional regulator
VPALPVAAPRARILASATAHIGREGVRGLRVERIARDAGVSTPLVYHYFGNRAGLVREALSEPEGGRREPGTTAAAEPTPTVEAPGDEPRGRPAPRDHLLAVLLAGLDEHEDARRSAVLQNELAASAVFDPALAAIFADDTARREGATARALRDVDTGPGPDVEAAARALVALADGLRERWLAGVTTLPRARLLLRAAVDRIAAP